MERGDIILKRDILSGEMIEYEFMRMSEEGFTCQGRRLSDDRLEWINMKQIRSTGRKTEIKVSDVPVEGQKKRSWTLGVDPVPEEHIKKKKRR